MIFKKTALFMLCSLCVLQAAAQQGTWTWMHGSTTVNLSGAYITQNVFAPANEPPSLYEPVYWRDDNGWLWVYGGYQQNPLKTVFTEMWCYNPYINQWKMVKGFSNTPVYGTKGISSPTNSPGARTYCCPAWIDNNGKFWLFSGMDFSFGNYCDDMWLFDPITNEWTWMHGSNQFASAPPVYGVKGVPSITNSPGHRLECYSSWCDKSGNFWIFGGQTFNTVVSQPNHNDMWRFDIATNEWTWMHGDDVPETPGSYGIKGVPNNTNLPPSRWCYNNSLDDNGDMIIYGGVHAVAGLPSYLSDTWKYNIANNQWTWVQGTSTANSLGNYPTSFCASNSTSNPASRYENKFSAADVCGNLWTFGGVRTGGFLSDVWIYVAAQNEWRLMKGNSTLNLPAVRGTMGVPNINNRPEGRSGGVAFLDTLNRFYIFGGAVTGNIQAINDVWRFELDTSCSYPSTCLGALPNAAFTSSDTLLCEKGSIDFFDNSTGNPTSWQWTFSGGSPATSTLQNPAGIFFANYGTYTVSLTVTNSVGSNTTSYTVTIVPNPPQPTITYSNNTLCTSIANSYQWYFNNQPLANATQQCITPWQQGNYYVIITDTNGCNSASNIFVSSNIQELELEGITISPNPTTGILTLTIDHPANGAYEAKVLDEKGRKVFQRTIQKTTRSQSENIDLSAIKNGVYIVMLEKDNFKSTKKIKIMH